MLNQNTCTHVPMACNLMMEVDSLNDIEFHLVYRSNVKKRTVPLKSKFTSYKKLEWLSRDSLSSHVKNWFTHFIRQNPNNIMLRQQTF